MPVLPFFQFYPSDYKRDTCALSLSAKGGWIDVLCMLHGAQNRGTMTLPPVAWARAIGATVDQAEAVIAELAAMKIAEVKREANGDVTISSRRMLRERITRENTRLRVERHRRNAACNADGYGSVTDNKSEVRSQKSESTILGAAAAPPGGEPVEKPPAKPRQRNALLDALCLHAEATDPSKATPPLWPKIAAALKAIREISPEVSPDEIARRCQNYRTRFTDAAFSATALAKHWGRCENPKGWRPPPVAASAIQEPPGWREWVRANATDPSISDRPWSELGVDGQKYIAIECGKNPPREGR